jgi:hypothetical protein
MHIKDFAQERIGDYANKVNVLGTPVVHLRVLVELVGRSRFDALTVADGSTQEFSVSKPNYKPCHRSPLPSRSPLFGQRSLALADFLHNVVEPLFIAIHFNPACTSIGQDGGLDFPVYCSHRLRTYSHSYAMLREHLPQVRRRRGGKGESITSHPHRISVMYVAKIVHLDIVNRVLIQQSQRVS